MSSPVAVRVDLEKLSELDSLEDLRRELVEAREARQEQINRAKDRAISEVRQLIRATPRRPRVRDTDPQTSHDAAVKALEREVTLKSRIMWAFYELGPLTADECAEIIGEDHNTVSTHVSDLRKHWGWLERTGEKRETRRGGSAYVLRCLLGPDTTWRQGDLLEEVES